jgi:hypothetical protein
METKVIPLLVRNPLTHDQHITGVQVDEDDFEHLKNYEWYAAQYNNTLLPCATVLKDPKTELYGNIWMHEIICKNRCNFPFGGLIDSHSNDLRKSNILVTNKNDSISLKNLVILQKSKSHHVEEEDESEQRENDDLIFAVY